MLGFILYMEMPVRHRCWCPAESLVKEQKNLLTEPPTTDAVLKFPLLLLFSLSCLSPLSPPLPPSQPPDLPLPLSQIMDFHND